MVIKNVLHSSKVWKTFSKYCPVLATQLLYKMVFGSFINFKDPKTINEKMQWLKINRYSDNELVTKCADKYAVREFVIEKGCSELLNDCYGHWYNVEEIDWDSLPDKFVLKCTHGSGYNIICENKDNFNKDKAIRQLDMWMHETYGYENCEMIYEKIKPQIIAEKFIETNDGKAPTDYKFFCSYGNPKFLYVMYGNDEIQDYYTDSWERLPIRSAGRPNSFLDVDKPVAFEDMKKYASMLSRDFPMVRVDFYCEDRIIFGELTFLTTGGFTKYDPKEYDLILGNLFPNVNEM